MQPLKILQERLMDLDSVQHIGLTGKTLKLNFIHFYKPEYLAAYCITKLPPLKNTNFQR